MDLYINTFNGIVVEYLSEKPDGVTVKYSHMPSLESEYGSDAKDFFGKIDTISHPGFWSAYVRYDGDTEDNSCYTEGDL